jgi:signal peptidase II
VASVRGTGRAQGPAAGGSRSAGAHATLWWAGVAAFGLATDAAGKAWALSALRTGHQITVAGGLLRFQLVINHGAALGIAAGYEPLLVAVGLAGVVLLGFWAVKAANEAERTGAALAAAGAAGNLLDRLTRPPAALHGGVVDWLHVPFYGPTFNLADVWLRGGLLLAVGAWLWQHRRRTGRKPDAASEPDPGT